MLVRIIRFTKLLFAFVAVAALSSGLASCRAQSDEAPVDNPYVNAGYPVYNVSVNETNEVTQIIDIRDDTVLYEDSWSDTDMTFVSPNTFDILRVPAELKLDDGKVVSGKAEAVTSVTDVAKLAESFNGVDNSVRAEILGRKSDSPPLNSDLFIASMSRVVVQDMVSDDNFDTVQFSLNDIDQARHIKNSTVADGYAKGFAAWQVEQGSEGYDSDAEYAYDFNCIERRFVPESDEMNSSAIRDSGLSLSLAGKSFNGSSTWLVKTDSPCSIVQVDADGKPLHNTDKSRP